MKKKMLDKVIMGAVIGGAIGSVIGVAIAPEKGKKTREELKETVIRAKDGAKKLFSKIKSLFGFIKTDAVHEMKKIPNEALKDPKEANK